MESLHQHDQLITMCPQHATGPILHALRAGVEQAIDFETLFAAALLYSITGRHGDERFSLQPRQLSQCSFGVLAWILFRFETRTLMCCVFLSDERYAFPVARRAPGRLSEQA